VPGSRPTVFLSHTTNDDPSRPRCANTCRLRTSNPMLALGMPPGARGGRWPVPAACRPSARLVPRRSLLDEPVVDHASEVGFGQVRFGLADVFGADLEQQSGAFVDAVDVAALIVHQTGVRRVVADLAPARTVYQPGQDSEPESVCGLVADGDGQLSAKHGVLVLQHEEFRVLLRFTAEQHRRGGQQLPSHTR
jgi:hypothetical protein